MYCCALVVLSHLPCVNSAVKQYTAPQTAGVGGDIASEQLTGAEKWTTVKIKDPKSPTKFSIFLGGSVEKQVL